MRKAGNGAFMELLTVLYSLVPCLSEVKNRAFASFTVVLDAAKPNGAADQRRASAGAVFCAPLKAIVGPASIFLYNT